MPVGADAARWATRGRCRRVLFVVHNVTSATRLLDVLPLFRDDLRVQPLVTCTGSSPFRYGVPELLARTGLPVLPWEQAKATPVDLAVSASLGGELHAIDGPLIVLSHGAGYNKRLATPGDPHPEVAPAFMSASWMLRPDGTPVADAFVLSHPEQLERLARSCPQAVPTAVLAGDPCFDRLLAARRYRDRYRRALGVRAGQRLVVLNSTWNPDSLFGDGGDDRDHDVLPVLLDRLMSELPVDTYRLAAVLHPNIGNAHGPGTLDGWLDRAGRRGLTRIDPLGSWRQTLIAADAVIGDHGSVSYYAAALGLPVLIAAATRHGLEPGSPVADFVRRAPRLDPYGPLPGGLEALLDAHRPLDGPATLTTSAPGDSAALLRAAFYRLIGIPEPAGPALLDPLPLPAHQPPSRTAPLRVLTEITGPGAVTVTRYADPRYEPGGAGEAHTAVHEDTLDPGRLALADVVVRYGEPDDPRLGPPQVWGAEVLALHPQCALAAYVTGPDVCVVRARGGALFTLEHAAGGGADPAAYASALYALLAAGRGGEALAGGLAVRTGAVVHRVRVARGPVRR
ncbi:hypothetical protein [Streptantibioticus silvisoli]|uniref:hypothetical protein n=1 Tax=Streptantibioticus silvisoli TaxID=2705255 RepID=UPI0035563376